MSELTPDGVGQLSHAQVTQWIGQIQTLQQQVADLKRDRDAAYAAADSWQARYTTEAQQRRADREQFQQQLDRLRAEIDRLRGNPDSLLDELSDGSDRSAEPAASEASLPAANPATLAEAQIECRQLRAQMAQLVRALQVERSAHEQTRHDLTTALGDAIDALDRRRLSS
jgi:chromosome segregation ATPase